MDNDSTRNGGLLSLAERAKRGWELLTREIMELEFPTYTSYKDREQPEYESWHKAIEAAIRLEVLEKRPEQVKILLYASIPKIGFLSDVPRHPPREVYETETRYWIAREPYRQWRLTQPNPPAGSLIHLWLGATPATESIPPVETSLPEPARPASVAEPKKRRRDDALTHAIRAALAVLSPNGGPLPSPRKLFDYLKESDSTRTITGLSNDGKALMWAGKVNDSPQKSDIRLLAARLRRWQS